MDGTSGPLFVHYAGLYPARPSVLRDLRDPTDSKNLTKEKAIKEKEPKRKLQKESPSPTDQYIPLYNLP